MNVLYTNEWIHVYCGLIVTRGSIFHTIACGLHLFADPTVRSQSVTTVMRSLAESFHVYSVG